ncbi:magnesium protoporphyrin IX methyltransferase [Pseudaestuariivita atlantica]|uniref:Magnesium protoporphyrin IX methyltransferase n=1 Tax=Pseudaestuariivita atlantica TaxID=1317121 RepID=A0A0L1JQ96_9RHOB|nr:magnesium protoporphyrin IX methyltransferase [Pseudaestuariivita atlantica]KNG93921.1 SAM-dependent methyltransferase [Pseudaestuariivita atlantica]
MSGDIAELPATRSAYARTRARVETYFDRTATRTWEALTSDAPVSRIRQTVRAGRDEMRAMILTRLPLDMTGQRVLDAGCGTGALSVELARRGAEVVGVDISPSLIGIARARLPRDVRHQVSFASGDMLSAQHGYFEHVVAMDSLIYYSAGDIARALHDFEYRTSGSIVFTVAPRSALLMMMWRAGQMFPKADRSPTMVPHSFDGLQRACRDAGVRRMLRPVTRVHRGFYISAAMELTP